MEIHIIYGAPSILKDRVSRILYRDYPFISAKELYFKITDFSNEAARYITDGRFEQVFLEDMISRIEQAIKATKEDTVIYIDSLVNDRVMPRLNCSSQKRLTSFLKTLKELGKERGWPPIHFTIHNLQVPVRIVELLRKGVDFSDSPLIMPSEIDVITYPVLDMFKLIQKK